MTSRPSLQVVAVVGATGTGKSELALSLAEVLSSVRSGPVEIVNADSMQVYRGMDIGTAKLTMDERRGIPHHLIDIWEVDQAANVADYQHTARGVISDVLGRGGLPILVGGSGLYVRAVLDDLRFPGTDPQVRARLQLDLERAGVGALHARLAQLDPAAAASILPTNGRRIVRALEVIELSGAPFSAVLPTPEPVYRHITIGLEFDRDALDRRLAERVNRMWESGLVGEVRNLTGLAGSPTASRALGYAQVLAMLAGEYDEAAARERTISATRKFARRQQSWFRRDPDVVWLPATAADLVERASDVVAAGGPLSTEVDASGPPAT